MQKEPAPQNTILCVGLIGPRHLCRPIWRELHMTVGHDAPVRKESYALEMVAEIPTAGIPYADVRVMGRTRAGEALGALLERALRHESPQIILFRTHRPELIEDACRNLPRAGLTLSLHWVPPHGSTDRQGIEAAATRIGAILHTYAAKEEPDDIASEIRTDIGEFAYRSGNYGSACAY